MTDFSVTQDGKPLDKSLYTWDKKTRTLSTEEDNLVLDFSEINYCTFKTGSNCTFKTGSYCMFNTGWGCTFDTGSICTFITGPCCTFNTGPCCTFKTGSSCTFDTSSNCTFDTSSNCTFKTGSYCTFKTDSSCTFKTGYNCTFKTGSDCIFKTSVSCTFTTDSDCIFNTYSNCTFKTGSYCAFKTGSSCTFNTGLGCAFNTGSSCTFDTSSCCTFDTGYACTFKTGSNCVIVRRDIFEVIQPLENEVIKLCPFGINGYISKRKDETAFYMDIPNGKREEYIIADEILSKVISRKMINGITVYKVINHNMTKQSYVIYDGENYSHGKTLQEAKESLIYKISNRDTSKYKDYDLNTGVSKKEAIQMYRCITGACEHGTRMFVESLKDVPESLTVQEIIEITKGQYGNDKFRIFLKENKNE